MGRRHLVLMVAGMIVATSCTNGAGDATSSVPPASTTTTFAPIEVISVSTTIAPGVDPGVHDQLVELVYGLIAATQELRGLSYIQLPAVVIMAFDDFDDRLRAALATDLSTAKLSHDEALLRLLGQYNDPPALENAIRELYTADGAIAFYDGAAAEVVIDGSRAELTALESSIVVRALAAALIDQYHNTYDQLVELDSAGPTDPGAALRTLSDADAIAVQLRYLQSLPEEDQVAAALEAADQPAALKRLPDVVREQLALPGESGVAFVDEVVRGGGYAALDRAYNPPPESMEQILHPARFAIRETVRPVPELAVEVDGYTTTQSGAYGEWQLRLLLQGAISPGLLTQTAAGWGGDAYQLLENGDEMLFVYIYGGDTADDAIEVAQALLALARGPMGAGDGVDSGGGVLWETSSRYVFVDRIGDGLMFIVATESAAGNAARGQVRVP